MKTLLIFSAFMLFSCAIGYCQTYEPYISKTKEWRHVQHLCLTDGGCTNLVIINFFNGDTVINEIQYSKFYQKQVQPNLTTGTLSYLIQEDTLNEKVYVYDFHFNKTALLYDFKLQKGDSFDIYVVDDIYLKSKVSNVDTITLANRKLKRIVFDDSQTLIEGIGFVSQTLIPSSGEIICVKDGNSLFYLNDNYRNCDTVFIQDTHNRIKNLISEESNNNIIIYPNPIDQSSVLKVRSKINEECQIEIYNCIGSLIKRDNFTDTYPIGLCHLAQGLYMVKIENNKNIVEVCKLFIK
jgi:hypothetical protein